MLGVERRDVFGTVRGRHERRHEMPDGNSTDREDDQRRRSCDQADPLCEPLDMLLALHTGHLIH